MDLPEIAYCILANLHLEQAFYFREVSSGWYQANKDTNRTPTNADWNSIICTDNASLLAYFVDRDKIHLPLIVDILYKNKHCHYPKIVKYLVLEYLNDFLTITLAPENNDRVSIILGAPRGDFMYLVRKYPIVREAFIGLLLVRKVARGSYGSLTRLLWGGTKEDLVDFNQYLVSMKYAEVVLMKEVYDTIISKSPSLMLTIHHSSGRYIPPERMLLDKYGRECSKEELLQLLFNLVASSKYPLLRMLESVSL